VVLVSNFIFFATKTNIKKFMQILNILAGQTATNSATFNI